MELRIIFTSCIVKSFFIFFVLKLSWIWPGRASALWGQVLCVSLLSVLFTLCTLPRPAIAAFVRKWNFEPRSGQLVCLLMLDGNGLDQRAEEELMTGS